jgi:hypothetical protein
VKLFPNGSEWRKWDLHVHTPSSSLENQYRNDWEAYLSAIEAFGDEVAVMGRPTTALSPGMSCSHTVHRAG